nr:hypothetical protein [Tanacetum cinerariifolium]
MIVGTTQFKSNKFTRNFSYPQSVPAYKNICKYLKNCFLAEVFSQPPSVLYQNYLREFWCTAVVDHPTPSIEDSEARPIKDSNIKFSVKNGLPSTTPKDGLHQSKSLLKGKPTDLQDTEGNLHRVIIGLPTTHPNKGINTSQTLPEGTNTDPKDLGRTIQLTDMGVELHVRFININDYSEGYLDIATAYNIGCLDIILTCVIGAMLLYPRGLLEEHALYNSVVNWNFLDRYDKKMWLEFKEFNEGSVCIWTTTVVVVMFDETTIELVKVLADSILKVKDEINPTEPVKESACSSTDDAIANKHILSLKRLARHPSVATPSKPYDAKKTKRIDLEDSDTEAAFSSSKEADEDKISSSSY